MPKINDKKTVIYGKNKDAATMQELKAKEAGNGQAVFFQNPEFIHDDDYVLEEHVKDAGKVIIIGRKDIKMFKRVEELHEAQGPGKAKVSYVDSPAMERAEKNATKRSGQGQAAQVPTDEWNKAKIQAWLTLNDVEFGANATKEELLDLVE